MSARSFPIHLDEPIVDIVSLAVIPVDAFSGQVVANGVKASIDGLFDRSIRNLSGHLVFVNLPIQPIYRVEVDASKAGYFSPPPSDFDPTTGKRHLVPLYRPADFVFEDAATLIRGVVCRGADPVVGARVWCVIATTAPMNLNPSAPALPSPAPFETRTGLRGSFALSLRIPLEAPARRDGKFKVTLHIEDRFGTRNFEVWVRDNRPNVFEDLIDITGTGEPPISSILSSQGSCNHERGTARLRKPAI